MVLRLASAHLQRGDIHALGHTLDKINANSLEDVDKSKYYYLRGIHCYETGEPGDAIVNFQRSRVILSEIGDYNGVTRCLVSIAMCYEEMNNYQEAARIQESLLGYMESKFDNPILTAQVLGDLAINYARMENYIKVLPLLNRGYQIAGEMGDNELQLILIRKFVEFYEVLDDQAELERFERMERELLQVLKQ